MDAFQQRNLEDEEIGVRQRMQCFYLPLFRDFCRVQGLKADQVRVLDCGCGNGLSVDCLEEAGFAAYGVDNATLRYQQWSGRSRLSMADGTRLPFAGASFDIVMSCGVLKHVGVAEASEPVYQVEPLPDQAERRRRFLAECLRVLRPGGVLYVDHPNGAFPIDFWHTRHGTRPRFHGRSESFLPTVKEVRGLTKTVEATCRVEALSPAGRFVFRRTARHWYGAVLTAFAKLFFALLRYPPFSPLAGSALNPYLVLRITRP